MTNQNENLNQNAENQEEVAANNVPADSRLVIIGSQKIPVPADLSVDAIKAGLSQMFPRISDIEPIPGENGSLHFILDAGEKGSVDNPLAVQLVKWVLHKKAYIKK